MRILLVNDDGFHAHGFDILRKIAAELSDDVWAVAPESDQSGLAHSLTLGYPLRVRKVSDRNFVLSGTPTDCVIMGVRELMPSPPDLVLSGVNHGQNAADDVTYSGTVAGAMEGAMLGIRSIALSQRVDWTSNVVHWENALTHGPQVVNKLIEADFDSQMFVNVNFPDCVPDATNGTVVVPQGSLEHGLYTEQRHDGRNKPYYWLRFSNREPLMAGETDLTALQAGKIAVTPLKPDMTFRPALQRLQSVVGQS